MRRLLVLLLLATVACSVGEDAGGPPVVQLDEFTVEATGVFTPGVNDVVVRNDGEFGHTVVFAQADGTVVGASPSVPPGGEIVFPVRLEAGVEYEVSCRIVVGIGERQIVDHYEEGMLTSIVVEAAAALSR